MHLAPVGWGCLAAFAAGSPRDTNLHNGFVPQPDGQGQHPGLEEVSGAQLKAPVVQLFAEVTQGRTVQPEHTKTQLEVGDPSVQQLGRD